MHKSLHSSCSALAKSGKPCRAAATAGGLCFFHANPKKASELGRIGGRRKRFSASEDVEPLPKLETAAAVRDAVGQLIADVHAGKINPRIDQSCSPPESAAARDRDNGSRAAARASGGTAGQTAVTSVATMTETKTERERERRCNAR